MIRTIQWAVGMAIVAALALSLPASAAADDPSTFRAASADGTHVFFTTEEQMVAADTDNASDLYDRSGSTTTLLSIGPTGGNASGQTVFFEAASDDGSTVLFRTFESLVATDTDSSIDLYRRSGVTTTLLSISASGGNGAIDVQFGDSTPDGTSTTFETQESLSPTDTDSSTDVYLQSGASTILISTGSINGNGAFNAFARGISSAGNVVFFTTSEPLVAADTDASTDVYQRAGSTTTLLSAGAINGNGAFSASFLNATANGARVLFSSSEPLVAADTDSQTDIYERNGGTTTLISAGAINGNGAFTSTFRGASGDGSRVFFTTSEQLASVDTDSDTDIYERSGGTTTRISGDATADNGAFDATFEGVSDTGTTVFFTTREALHTGDTDSSTDIYAHLGDGTVDGITSDHAAPDEELDVEFGANTGNSVLGEDAYFTTREALPGSGDLDDSTDVYQYDFGFNFAFRVSGPAVNFDGGQAGFPATFEGASDDGSRVFFQTFEQLAPQDIDGEEDVYGTFVGSSLVSREAKPPETTIGAGVTAGSSTSDTTPVFSFTSSEAGSTFQCRLTTGSFVACSSPEVFGPLAEGSRTIEIRATDAAGNVDPTPATRTFTVDTIPPDVSIDPGQPELTNDPTPQFDFDADQAATFECRVDTASYGACSGPGNTHIVASIADGAHTFRVRARDAAGNTSFAHEKFTVDTTGPDTTIEDVKVVRKKKRATVTFSGDDPSPGSEPLTFECKLDGGGFDPCSNGSKVYKQLSKGSHTVQVRARDGAGNPDPSPASENFTV